MYKSRKSIVGDNAHDNQQTEVASHNRINFTDSGSLQIVTLFLCALILGSIVFMALAHTALFSTLIVASFIGFFGIGWIVALSFTVRHVSASAASVAIDRSQRERAANEAYILHAAENYAIYRDETGAIKVAQTVLVTENRQFLPGLPSPQEPNAQEGILDMWDGGMTARRIHEWLKYNNREKPKEAQVSMRQITTVLNRYRPGWQERSKTSNVVDSDPEPEDEF